MRFGFYLPVLRVSGSCSCDQLQAVATGAGQYRTSGRTAAQRHPETRQDRREEGWTGGG